MPENLANDTKLLEAFWWNEKPNFGDQLVPYLPPGLSGRKITWSDSPSKRVFMSIGSVLHLAKPGWTVWGSGFGTESDKCVADVEIKCVRGPRTSRRLEELGISGIPAYGDPALLTPKVFSPPGKSGPPTIGIAPHYLDLQAKGLWLKLVAFMSRLLGRKRLVILNPFDSVENFLRKLCACSCVLSSGLHPLILADAYKIPNCWIDFAGGTRKYSKFKFLDYFESVGRIEQTAIEADNWRGFRQALDSLDNWREISWSPDNLLKAASEWCSVTNQVSSNVS